MSDNPDSRIDDYNLIEKALKSDDAQTRRQAGFAKDKLDRESTKIRSMRDDLVDAHRGNDKQRIEELHLRIKDEERRNAR